MNSKIKILKIKYGWIWQIKQNPMFYDLVIIDTWLDELDGRKVYSDIKKSNPNS
jgi:DNA-binding response OmpR family regulator